MTIQLPGEKKRAATCGIEYAHVYSHQEQFTDQLASIARLEAHQLRLLRENVSTSKIILVDDYSTPFGPRRLDLRAFLRVLAEENAEPDVMVAESSLTPFCAKTLYLVGDERVKRSLTRYIQRRRQYPCSLFVAAWYLLRLGVFGAPTISTMFGQWEKLYTDSVLTILPEHFKQPEAAAIRIIESTEHSRFVANIAHEFYDCLPGKETFEPSGTLKGQVAAGSPHSTVLYASQLPSQSLR